MAPSQREAGTQLAAGCLVWRERGGDLEVLLVHRPRYRDWSWPKGKLEEGESLAQCALRETAEETGRHVILGRPLPSLNYRLKGGRRKEVFYWAARRAKRADAAAVRAQGLIPRASRSEIDKVAWVSALGALRRLTRDSDAKPLRALVRAHMSGTLDTTPLVLVRHARAKTRSAWPGGESDRPLTATGRRRAEALVEVLAAYGVGRIISSPWERCVASMQPYAASSGLDITTTHVLSEAGAAGADGELEALIAGLLASRDPVAICSHRPVLGPLIAPLAAHSRSSLRAALPTKDPYLRTGEALVAHVAHGTVSGTGKKTKTKAQIVSLEKVRPAI